MTINRMIFMKTSKNNEPYILHFLIEDFKTQQPKL